MVQYRLRSDGAEKSKKEIRVLRKALGFNSLLPRVWTSAICDTLKIDPIFDSPKPEASDKLKIFIKDGFVEDVFGSWFRFWSEVDRFQDIAGGLTKLEQETAFLTFEQEKEFEQKLQKENKTNIKKDQILNLLKTKTSEQIETYINENLTTIASTKAILKSLTKAIVYLIKKEL